MKMMYGNVPVTNLQIVKHDVSTDDATMFASDLQAGVTAYARGQKITGTGKAFSFASYGSMFTNESTIIPQNINIIEIASTNYPVQLKIELKNMKDVDFTVSQLAAVILVDGVSYDITVEVNNGELILACDQTLKLQVFFGKDDYV